MLKTLTLLALLTTASPVLAQGGGDMTPDSVDVVEAASAAGNLDTLLKAVMDAGLAETLADARDVTIIDLALQADKAKLAQALKYHAIPKAYLVADIPAGDTEVETLAGEKLTLSITVTTPSGMEAMVVVVKQDIKSNHSVVHAIDAVLKP